jgi:basic membrane protein A and related proteins
MTPGDNKLSSAVANRRGRRRQQVATTVAVAVGALLLAACSNSSSATGSSEASSNAASHSDFSACLMISATGIADHSFNQSAWAAMTEAKSKLGITTKYLAQSGSTDYATIGAQFVQQGCSMIIGVGFNTQTTINTLAPQNPNIKFALIDSTLTAKVPNAVSLTYQTDQAGFLGGYLAAGLSKSGTVGVYGNEAIPPVELYMTGYVYGVDYYNKTNNANIKVIGWDPLAKTGQFVGSFTDVNKGKLITQAEIQQGADVIFPVAGPIDAGTATAVRAAGGPKAGYYMLWVDSDGCVSNPDGCDVIVSTVQKNIQPSLYAVISKTVNGNFPTGSYLGTLSNNGVGLAPYHNLSADVPAKLQEQITQLTKDVASGAVKVGPAS